MNRILVAVFALLLAAAPQDDRKFIPKQGKGVEEGKPAPDFKLKKLVLDESKKKEKEKPEYVELSSFQGKKPVALIFGSYT